MTVYRITPATSVFTDIFRGHAFAADSAGPDSLTVDAGAFLVANRLGMGASKAPAPGPSRSPAPSSRPTPRA